MWRPTRPNATRRPRAGGSPSRSRCHRGLRTSLTGMGPNDGPTQGRRLSAPFSSRPYPCPRPHRSGTSPCVRLCSSPQTASRRTRCRIRGGPAGRCASWSCHAPSRAVIAAPSPVTVFPYLPDALECALPILSRPRSGRHQHHSMRSRDRGTEPNHFSVSECSRHMHPACGQ